MLDPEKLYEGAVIIIASFDDIPEHQFVVHSVEDDCVTGVALTGPLTGAYGEPDFEMILGFSNKNKAGLGS